MRKWLIVLMAAVAIGATGILGWLYMRQDRKGPEITIAESKKNSYTSDMTTEDMRLSNSCFTSLDACTKSIRI